MANKSFSLTYSKCSLLGLVLVFLTASSLAQQSSFVGKRVVHILDEPRHRTVHREGDLYLLDIQINPGDMTLPHTHDAAILYTFISNGEGPLGGRVASNTDYISENLTHEVENPGPGLFRIIALTSYGHPALAVKSDLPQGLSTPQLENDWFRSYRVRLAPGESTNLQLHRNPSVVVQVSDGKLHVSRSDGITSELDAMGDWAWRESGQAYMVSNVGEETVVFVVNEARI